MLTGENRSTGIKASPSATLSITDLTMTGLTSKTGLRAKSILTKYELTGFHNKDGTN